MNSAPHTRSRTRLPECFAALAENGVADVKARVGLLFHPDFIALTAIAIRRLQETTSLGGAIRQYMALNDVGGSSSGARRFESTVVDVLLWISGKRFGAIAATARQFPQWVNFCKILVGGITMRNLMVDFLRDHLSDDSGQKAMAAYDGSAQPVNSRAQEKQVDVEADFGVDPAPPDAPDRDEPRQATPLLVEAIGNAIRTEPDRRVALALALITQTSTDILDMHNPASYRTVFVDLPPAFNAGFAALRDRYLAETLKLRDLADRQFSLALRNRAELAKMSRGRDTVDDADPRTAELLHSIDEHTRVGNQHLETEQRVRFCTEGDLQQLIDLPRINDARNLMKRARRKLEAIAVDAYGSCPAKEKCVVEDSGDGDV